MTGFFRHNLRELASSIPLIRSGDSIPELPVTGITLDSRQVQPGNIFVALQGGSVDGHQFIEKAVGAGACAVVGTQPGITTAVPYFQVENGRLALALLSAAFYSHPGRQMTMVGVTGTDGKTSTSNLIYQIFLAAGLRAGIISTVNATIGGEVIDTGFHVTTPEAPDVQRYLARMLSAGLTHVVVEATSHGLDQHRVTGCEFDVGVVTNITHEHLDYHSSYEAYRRAKGRLVEGLAHTLKNMGVSSQAAVINADDSSYDYLRRIAAGKVFDYSLGSANASIRAEKIVTRPDGMTFEVTGPGFSFPVETKLVGLFNVSNTLAAIGATVAALGIAPEAAARGIAALGGVPGRMERIDMGQDFSAIVDFAHTPNALRRVLEAVRPLTDRRVIAIFGSAGLRDRQKRRMMAEVSSELADVSIFTAEDPRTESLQTILAEMAAGADSRGGRPGETYYCIPDRRAALLFAVELAGPGDMVLACGKGHEQSMCFGTVEFPWDDRTAVRAALAEHLHLDGPNMPYLPELFEK